MKGIFQEPTSQRSYFVVAIAAVVCYANILPNDFCYDDIPVVQNNQKIQGEHQWGAIWTTDYWSQTQSESPHRDLLYRPVALSLFRLTRLIAGACPLPFHAISILLHAVCAVLVVQVVLFLGYSTIAGLLAGLVFAVLPIHSEAVASVVGQTDLLATAGTIAAVLCHFRFVRAEDRARQVLWIAAAMACAFVAMGAKESGICVVPIIVLAELLNLALGSASGTLAQSERTLGSALGLRLLRATYLFIPLAAYLALRYYALGGTFHQAPAPTRTVNVLVDAPFWQRTLGVLQAWGMYWSKTIFPRELVIEYAIHAVRLPASIWQAYVLSGIFWITGLVVISICAWRNNQRASVFLVLALFLSYLPTSNGFVLIQVFFAERIWYLPSAFVAGLFALIGVRLLEKRIWRRVGVLVLCTMMVRCWVRNAEWKNNGTLFAATYADHPQSVQARHLYGQWLTQHGELEQGMELLRKALEIDLGFTDAHRSLGRALLKAGKTQEALRELQIADMQVPGHPQTKAALAETSTALESQTGPMLAELERKAVEHPEDPERQLELVRFLRSIARAGEALKILERDASTFGENADWIAEWAVTLVYLDRRDEAIERYKQASELSPSNAQRLVELAMLLIERRAPGDAARARVLAERAIALAPQKPNTHAALAEILALEGNIAAARQSLRMAIQLTPDGSEYRRLLIEREKSLGQ